MVQSFWYFRHFISISFILVSVLIAVPDIIILTLYCVYFDQKSEVDKPIIDFSLETAYLFSQSGLELKPSL